MTNSQIRIISILPRRYQVLIETEAEEGADFIGGVIDNSGKLNDAQKAEVLALLEAREAEIEAAMSAEYPNTEAKRQAVYKAKTAIDDVIVLAEKFANAR